MPRSRFLGNTGVPLPEFQEDIHKFWGTHQIFQIFTSKLNKTKYLEISVHFLFKFELDVDSFGSRWCVDDGEVVSAIALVLNSPANLLFYIKIAFLAFCYEIRVFCHCCVLDWLRNQYPLRYLSLGKYMCQS